MAAPAAGTVVVDGPGPLAVEVTHQLRRVGVGVRAGALAADAELAAPAGAAPPVLVVLARERPVPVWARRSVAGPRRAAPAGGGRRDHDRRAARAPGPVRPAWPASPDVGRLLPRRRPADLTGDPAARVLAAAVVTVTTLALLRGDVRLAAISTEIAPGAETVTHRLWHLEPGCRCASETMAG